MILELREPWDVVTPLGCGKALLIETGTHDNLYTVVYPSGALVTHPQRDVRLDRNYTLGLNFDHDAMKQVIGG